MPDGLLEILVIALAVFIIVAYIYFRFVVPFTRERDYIKSELNRSYTDAEYRHWKRELKKLYVSSVPFFGRFLARHIKKH